jgi:hypothetical protein
MSLPLAYRVTTDSLSAIAKSIVLTKESPPLRLPVQTGTERTAVLALENTGTFSFDSTVVASGGNAYALLIRHPLVPLWMSGTFTGTFVQYQTLFATATEGASGSQSATVVNIPLDDSAYFVNTGTLPSWLGNNVVNNPRYTIPIGVDKILGVDYMYVPPGALAVVQVTFGASTACGGQINIYNWTGPGSEELVGTVTNSGNTNQLNYTFSVVGGWYRWGNGEFYSSTTTSLSVAFYPGWITGGTPAAPSGTLNFLWPFNIPSEFIADTPYPWADTRVNSASALFTNVTEVLGKSGTVLAARLIAEDGYWVPAPIVVSSRAPTEKYFGALEHGVYSFTSPSPESQVYQRAWRQATTSSYNNPVVYLDSLGYGNQFIFTDNNNSPYGQLAVTVNWHIEFRTSSILFPNAVSVTPLEELHRAHVAVGMLPNFMQNEQHMDYLKMLGSAIRSVGGSLVRHGSGPNLSRSLKTVGGLLASNLKQNIPGTATPIDRRPRPGQKGFIGPLLPKGRRKNKRRPRSRGRSRTPKRG